VLSGYLAFNKICSKLRETNNKKISSCRETARRSVPFKLISRKTAKRWPISRQATNISVRIHLQFLLDFCLCFLSLSYTPRIRRRKTALQFDHWHNSFKRIRRVRVRGLPSFFTDCSCTLNHSISCLFHANTLN